MKRTLQPELLDELPPSDPRAIHSRQDLRRINWVMGNARALVRFLDSVALPDSITLAEIGAGDGNIGFQIATHFSELGIAGELLLIDREPAVANAPFVKNWTTSIIKADVFDWLENAPRVDVIVANLFLHHFEEDALRRLLALGANATRVFAAAEPLRERFAPFFARHVWAMGCNEVTVHDAVISVRAGFRDRELSRLWPNEGWNLVEKRAGLFTHFFGATRSA